MSDEELAKDLGPFAALTIGVGTMIGAGIFVLPRQAITDAGSFAVVSFVLGGVIALFTAFSASELGTAMPKSGGAYYYVNRALGPFFGTIAGWSNWLGLAFASAFYMVGFGRYIQNILGVAGSLELGIVSIAWVKIIGIVGAALFTFINYVGAKETGKLQNVIVAILVVILAIFTVLGTTQANAANLPEATGYGPMFATTGLIFVSYLGFVQITSVAEEIKEPGKNLPRAIIGSVLIVTVIYVLVLIVMSAAVEPGFISSLSGQQIAVVEVGRRIFWPLGTALLVGGLLATASSANASILASSRINFAMGRDRIVTPDLNEIHDRYGTPYKSIAITGGLILLFILLANVETLSTLSSVLHLVIYALLNIALIVMREAEVAEYEPSYTVPLYPITPIIGAVVSLALIYFIDPRVIAIGGAFIVFAGLWYFGYARSRTTATGVLGDLIRSRSDELPDRVVEAAASVEPDSSTHRVMVPLANPDTERDLIKLGAAIAKHHGGTLDAVHIVTVPDQTDLQYASEHIDEFGDPAGDILERARVDAEELGIPIETRTVVSHRGFEEVFDAAKTHNADTVVMGWGGDSHGSPGRVESAYDEVMQKLPCDFIVMKDRGFDPSRVLVPTAGGPDSELSAAIARILRDAYGSEVTLLHVADDEAAGREFLESWAEENDLAEATLRIETGDVEAAIERAARDATLMSIGATEQGLLSRLVSDSLTLDIIDDLDCTVLLTETAHDRSLRERLFGSR
ncbi:MAG: amino acid permease [Halobacteriales archaeon]|nr:amino acid permease [Halobacteriales archaeon]